MAVFQGNLLRDVGFEEWLEKSTRLRPFLRENVGARLPAGDAGVSRPCPAPERGRRLRPGCTAPHAERSPAAMVRTFHRFPAARQR